MSDTEKTEPTEIKRGRGRPSKYTQELVEEIITLLSEGKTR